MRAYHWTRPNLDLSTGIKNNVRHMCSARSGNGPTRVNTIDKQLKNESVKKEDTEFCGENLIVSSGDGNVRILRQSCTSGYKYETFRICSLILSNKYFLVSHLNFFYFQGG